MELLDWECGTRRFEQDLQPLDFIRSVLAARISAHASASNMTNTAASFARRTSKPNDNAATATGHNLPSPPSGCRGGFTPESVPAVGVTSLRGIAAAFRPRGKGQGASALMMRNQVHTMRGPKAGTESRRNELAGNPGEVIFRASGAGARQWVTRP
jgi:hypothetical protein